MRAVAENRSRFHLPHSPVARPDFSLKLTGHPAGMTDEDPQARHRPAAGKKVAQEPRIRAQENPIEDTDRVAMRVSGAKQEPHRREIDGPPEVHLGRRMAKARDIRKEPGDGHRRRPVDDDTDWGGRQIAHHQDDRVCEEGIRQLASGDEENRARGSADVGAASRRPRSPQRQERAKRADQAALQKGPVSHRRHSLRRHRTASTVPRDILRASPAGGSGDCAREGSAASQAAPHCPTRGGRPGRPL